LRLSLNESYSVVRETVDVAELYRINYQENQTRGLQVHNVTMEAKTNQDHSALLILVWSDLLSL
jgi:hypothetical protein